MSSDERTVGKRIRPPGISVTSVTTQPSEPLTPAGPAELVAWTGRQPSAGRLGPDIALELLPGDHTQDPFTRLAAAFLLGYRAHSARGYLTDLKAWASWCQQLGVHPFDARRHHVDAWVRAMETEPLPRTGRPLANASVARRLSAVSQFYDYGIGVDVLTFSPIANVRRPHVSDNFATTALSRQELGKLLDVAEQDSASPGR